VEKSNPNIGILNKFKAPKSKNQKRVSFELFGVWSLGHLDFDIVWDLMLRI
jgi:hypothetical protein